MGYGRSLSHHLTSSAGRFRRARHGTVAVIAALSLSGMVGMSAMAVDINRGLQQRVTNQQVADTAALAAALAYKASGKESVLLPTARDIARINGLPDATVVATLVMDVPSAGSKAVRVTVGTTVPFAIARGLGLSGGYDVGAVATASLATAGAVPGCIIGLAGSGRAISTSGGATIDAPSCAVTGAGDVFNGGTRINAKTIVSGAGSVGNDYGTMIAEAVRYAVSFNNPSWNGNVPTPDKRTQAASNVVDPLASDPAIMAARTLIGTAAAPRALANPTTPDGADWTMGYSPSASVVAFRRGQSGNYVVPAGNYTIGRLQVDGGVNVTFQPGSTITVARGVSIGGGSPVDFGHGDVAINGGFQGGGGVVFGNGTLSIGSGSVRFTGTNTIGNGAVTINADLSIGGGATMRIGNGAHGFRSLSIGGGSWMAMGTGNVDVTAGITVGGDSTVAMGAGNYRIGSAGSGKSIALSGSGVMLMADGAFDARGAIATEGGSRLVFGRATNHLINGELRIAGSVLFGAGRYTVAGDVVNGTGGTTWAYRSPMTGTTYGETLEGTSTAGFDMAGVNVSFILSGAFNLSGGAKTLLIAPVTDSGGALSGILVDSDTAAATNWAAGSSNVFSGAVHLPRSEVTMSGGNTTLSTGRCFMLIASRITATGGAAAGSLCVGVGTAGGSGSDTIELIG